jgi:hypothetical protein
LLSLACARDRVEPVEGPAVPARGAGAADIAGAGGVAAARREVVRAVANIIAALVTSMIGRSRRIADGYIRSDDRRIL